MDIQTYFWIYLGIGLVVNIFLTIVAGTEIWHTQEKEFSEPEFSSLMFSVGLCFWPITILVAIYHVISDASDSKREAKLDREYLDEMAEESDRLFNYLKDNYLNIYEKIESGENVTEKDIDDLSAICDYYDALYEEINDFSTDRLSNALRKAILVAHATFPEATARKIEKELMESLKHYSKIED